MDRFSYRPRVSNMLLAGGLFAIAAAYLGHRAYFNDRGLILNGVIKLGVEGATVFYGALATVAALIALVAAVLTLSGLVRGPQILFAGDHLSIPQGLFGAKYTTVPFRELWQISPHKVGSQEMLIVRTLSGSHTLLKSHFRSEADYSEVISRLARLCAANAQTQAARNY